jgi:hypothetical protein
MQIKIAPIEIQMNDKLTAIVDAFDPIADFKPLSGHLRDHLGNVVKHFGTNDIHKVMWDFNGLSASGPHHNINPSNNDFKSLVEEVRQIQRGFRGA